MNFLFTNLSIICNSTILIHSTLFKVFISISYKCNKNPLSYQKYFNIFVQKNIFIDEMHNLKAKQPENRLRELNKEKLKGVMTKSIIGLLNTIEINSKNYFVNCRFFYK
jgi:hypothetical protein